MTVEPNSRPHADRIPAGASDRAREIHKRIVHTIESISNLKAVSPLDEVFKSEYMNLLTLFDQYQRQVLCDYGQRETCTAGCSYCCHHWVEDVYSFEAEIIADYIRTKYPDSVANIIHQFQEDESALSYLDERLCDKGFSDQNDDYIEGLLDEFYRLRRPCALLSPRGTCLVYPVRPLTCRTYISFSDPKLCDPANSRNGGGDTYILDMEENAADLLDRLHIRFDRFDGDVGLRSLVAKYLGRYKLSPGRQKT